MQPRHATGSRGPIAASWRCALPRAASPACFIAALVLPPAVAAAQTDEAALRFEEGVSQLQAQRYADAIDAFQRSLRVREAAGTLYNLGLALRGLNRCREATAALTRQAAIDGNAERRAAGEQLLTETRACVAEVSLTVRGRPDELLVDGVSTPLGEGVHAVRLDPGTHHIRARREGYQPASETVALERGGRAALLLDLSVALRGTLTLDTTASVASLRVDGELVAPGRRAVEVPAGRHHVEVLFTADGPAQRREVDVPPGGRAVVSLSPPVAPHLAVRPAPERPAYTRWWFWASVGSAAIAATIGVLAATGAFDSQAAPFAGSGSWGQVPFGITFP